VIKYVGSPAHENQSLCDLIMDECSSRAFHGDISEANEIEK